ncbi:MAG: phenylalanine--tRNA ligase beta subunit-related protein, partial [Gaiellaceae bacterium]
GEESEVTAATTEVLLEAANFEPIGLLHSSERLRLRTEGSNRWEKGVDPYLAGQAAVLATELIVQLAGARWVGHTDVQGSLPERPVVRYRPDRADVLIGLETEPQEQRGLLERLGFEVGEDWSVTVPTWRARDVTREVDVIEEIARARLDAVPFTLPRRRAMFGRLTREQRLRRRIEDVLAGIGFAEAYTPSLVQSDPDPRAIRLPEPQTAEHAVLRTTLLPSLVEAGRRNLDAGNERIALFEIARVYSPRESGLPDEHLHVGGVVEGGFARAKGAVEAVYAALKAEPVFERTQESFLHPGKAACVGAGWAGEVDPRMLEGGWGAFELDLGLLAEEAREPVVYEDVITFPAVRQDLAFVVDETVPAGELIAEARAAAGPDLRE